MREEAGCRGSRGDERSSPMDEINVITLITWKCRNSVIDPLEMSHHNLGHTLQPKRVGVAILVRVSPREGEGGG